VSFLAENRVHQDEHAGPGPQSHAARWLQVVLLALLTTVSGCGGCIDSSTTAHVAEKQDKQEGKKPQKPKADFDLTRLVVAPADATALPQSVKPGHWFYGSYESKANNFDFTGSMTVAATDQNNKLLELAGVAYELETIRPIVLAKGQSKNLEAMFYVPPRFDRTQTWVTKRLLTERTGSQMNLETHLLEHLPGYEYEMLVLANDPDRYRFLKVLDSIRPPGEVDSGNEFENHYRLHFPRTKNRAPLANHALAWTTTAYILWDDIDPNWLKPEQQQAMIDWLHWGGQLIISGPLSLDKLKGSFLEPYLPATFGGSLAIDQELLDTFSEPWTVDSPGDITSGKHLLIAKPWQGVQLDRHPEAKFIPDTGELLVERHVGRGRVVMSAFRLNQREFLAWHSFDSLVNNLLLRRAPREFALVGDEFPSLVLRRQDGKPALDDKANTRLRFFARDGLNLAALTKRISTEPTDENPPPTLLNFRGTLTTPTDIPEKAKPGVAAWNDLSPVSDQARMALIEAANIEVPPREFVLLVLVGYLAVLVPVNWLVFRIIGRVEWAWIAAPVIAVATGLVVVRLANLNIGFARSQTEVAILETQAGYPRAHLSRYTALYTSLSSTYDLHFNDPSAMALPFPRDTGFALLEDQRRPTVSLSLGDGVTLAGLQVPSNTTGLVHSEQMFDLGGAIEWRHLGTSRPHAINNTRHAFSGAGVIRCRTERGRRAIESYWIGRFAPGDDVEVDFQSDRAYTGDDSQVGTPVAKTRTPASINLRSLIALAEGVEHLQEGEARLVAWSEEALPGLEISPVAAQSRSAAVLVANLSYGDDAEPQRDANTRFDFKVKSYAVMEEEEINPPQK